MSGTLHIGHVPLDHPKTPTTERNGDNVTTTNEENDAFRDANAMPGRRSGESLRDYWQRREQEAAWETMKQSPTVEDYCHLFMPATAPKIDLSASMSPSSTRSGSDCHTPDAMATVITREGGRVGKAQIPWHGGQSHPSIVREIGYETASDGDPSTGASMTDKIRPSDRVDQSKSNSSAVANAAAAAAAAAISVSDSFSAVQIDAVAAVAKSSHAGSAVPEQSVVDNFIATAVASGEGHNILQSNSVSAHDLMRSPRTCNDDHTSYTGVAAEVVVRTVEQDDFSTSEAEEVVGASVSDGAILSIQTTAPPSNNHDDGNGEHDDVVEWEKLTTEPVHQAGMATRTLAAETSATDRGISGGREPCHATFTTANGGPVSYTVESTGTMAAMVAIGKCSPLRYGGNSSGEMMYAQTRLSCPDELTAVDAESKENRTDPGCSSSSRDGSSAPISTAAGDERGNCSNPLNGAGQPDSATACVNAFLPTEADHTSPDRGGSGDCIVAITSDRGDCGSLTECPSQLTFRSMKTEDSDHSPRTMDRGLRTAGGTMSPGFGGGFRASKPLSDDPTELEDTLAPLAQVPAVAGEDEKGNSVQADHSFATGNSIYGSFVSVDRSSSLSQKSNMVILAEDEHSGEEFASAISRLGSSPLSSFSPSDLITDAWSEVDRVIAEIDADDSSALPSALSLDTRTEHDEHHSSKVLAESTVLGRGEYVGRASPSREQVGLIDNAGSDCEKYTELVGRKKMFGEELVMTMNGNETVVTSSRRIRSDSPSNKHQAFDSSSINRISRSSQVLQQKDGVVGTEWSTDEVDTTSGPVVPESTVGKGVMQIAAEVSSLGDQHPSSRTHTEIGVDIAFLEEAGFETRGAVTSGCNDAKNNDFPVAPERSCVSVFNADTGRAGNRDDNTEAFICCEKETRVGSDLVTKTQRCIDMTSICDSDSHTDGVVSLEARGISGAVRGAGGIEHVRDDGDAIVNNAAKVMEQCDFRSDFSDKGVIDKDMMTLTEVPKEGLHAACVMNAHSTYLLSSCGDILVSSSGSLIDYEGDLLMAKYREKGRSLLGGGNGGRKGVGDAGSRFRGDTTPSSDGILSGSSRAMRCVSIGDCGLFGTTQTASATKRRASIVYPYHNPDEDLSVTPTDYGSPTSPASPASFDGLTRELGGQPFLGELMILPSFDHNMDDSPSRPQKQPQQLRNGLSPGMNCLGKKLAPIIEPPSSPNKRKVGPRHALGADSSPYQPYVPPKYITGIPTFLSSLSHIQIRALSAHPEGSHALFISTDAMLFSVGSNRLGQCGVGKHIPQVEDPTLITAVLENGGKAVTASAGVDYSLVVIETKLDRISGKLRSRPGAGSMAGSIGPAPLLASSSPDNSQNHSNGDEARHHQMYAFGSNDDMKLGLMNPSSSTKGRSKVSGHIGSGSGPDVTVSPLPRRVALQVQVYQNHWHNETSDDALRRGIVEVAASRHHSMALVRHHDESVECYSWGWSTCGALGLPMEQGEVRQHLSIPTLVPSLSRSRSRRRDATDAGGSIPGLMSLSSPSSSLPSSSSFPGYPYSQKHEHSPSVMAQSVLSNDECPRQISLGPRCSLVVTSRGRCYSFGSSSDGLLGLGRGIMESRLPELVDFPHRSCNVSRCATSDGSSPKCRRPQKHPETRIERVSVGARHALAISTDGEVYSWGCASHGRMGTDGNSTISAHERSPADNHKILTCREYIRSATADGGLSKSQEHSMKCIQWSPKLLSVSEMKAHNNDERQDDSKFYSWGEVQRENPSSSRANSRLKFVRAFAGLDSSLFITDSGAAFSCGKKSGRLGQGFTVSDVKNPKPMFGGLHLWKE